jgi:hemerythrin-like domain-containing protein
MTDVISILKEDHREVERMAAEFDSAGSVEEKKKVARQIIRELAVHAAVEEVLVYPALRIKVKDGGDRYAERSIEEHDQVKLLLSGAEESMQKFPDEDRFAPEIRSAITTTRKHIEEEEREVFPLLEQNMNRERLEQMGRLAEKIKPLLPTHPHPLVPGTATAQLLAGPLASLADHVRDFFAKVKHDEH